MRISFHMAIYPMYSPHSQTAASAILTTQWIPNAQVMNTTEEIKMLNNNKGSYIFQNKW